MSSKASPKKGSKAASPRALARKKTRKYTFTSYIYKVLKQVHPEIGTSKRSTDFMNAFVLLVSQRIIDVANQLRHDKGSKTLSSREIQSAVRLVLPGELAKHAVSEGTKAITKFVSA